MLEVQRACASLFAVSLSPRYGPGMAISRRRTRRGRPARDPLGPDGWDGVPPTPPAAEARWDGVLGLIAEVDARRDAPPDAPLEPRSTDDGVQILDFSGVSSPVASSLEYLAQTDLMG